MAETPKNVSVTITAKLPASWNHDHQHPIGYVDLGHTEALETALTAKDQVEILEEKIKLAKDPHAHAASKNGGECPCGCGKLWAGLTGPATKPSAGVWVQTAPPPPEDTAKALARIGKAFSKAGQGMAEAFGKLSPIIGELAEKIALVYGVPVADVVGKTVIGTKTADYVLQPGKHPDEVDVHGPAEGQAFGISVCKGPFPVIGIDPQLLQAPKPPPLANGGFLSHHTASPSTKVDPGLLDPQKTKYLLGFDGSMSGLDGPLASAYMDKDGFIHFKNSWNHDWQSPIGNAKGIGIESSCICITAGPDMDGPDIECPVHGIDSTPAATLYAQAQKVDPWPGEDYTEAGTITPKQLALAFGVPPEILGVSTDQTDEVALPTLFVDPEPEPDTSSHLWCDSCNVSWDFHKGDPVACYSAGYVRKSTPVEEKLRWTALHGKDQAA